MPVHTYQCAICKEFFTTNRARNGSERRYCGKPACHRAQQRAHHRKFYASHKDRQLNYQRRVYESVRMDRPKRVPLSKRLCAVCKKPLPENRRFYHERCTTTCRTDGNYIFDGDLDENY